MPSTEEKNEFSKRLRLALNRGPKPVKGATDLARRFNLRHPEAGGVSVQTAHKWLNGLTIPTTDKIKTLAQWLEVSEHWLHYGPPPLESAIASEGMQTQGVPLKVNILKSSISPLRLAEKIRALPEAQRYLLEELIAQFYERVPGHITKHSE